MTAAFCRPRPAAVTLALALLALRVTAAVGFEGWAGIRVIPLDGRAERLAVADLGGDGRDDVILVNPRQARLDLYRWLQPAERVRHDTSDPTSLSVCGSCSWSSP